QPPTFNLGPGNSEYVRRLACFSSVPFPMRRRLPLRRRMIQGLGRCGRRLDANASGGADVIFFNISTTPLISPASALPLITDPVTIDGASQPGFAGVPLIEINGTSAGA